MCIVSIIYHHEHCAYDITLYSIGYRHCTLCLYNNENEEKQMIIKKKQIMVDGGTAEAEDTRSIDIELLSH